MAVPLYVFRLSNMPPSLFPRCGSVGIRSDSFAFVGDRGACGKIRRESSGLVANRCDSLGFVGIRRDLLGYVGICGDSLGFFGARLDMLGFLGFFWTGWGILGFRAFICFGSFRSLIYSITVTPPQWKPLERGGITAGIPDLYILVSSVSTIPTRTAMSTRVADFPFTERGVSDRLFSDTSCCM